MSFKYRFLLCLIIQYLFCITASADQLTTTVNLTFSLEELTIDSLHELIKSQQLTCEQVINLYIDRIKKYNLNINITAPINAITEINPSVIDQARSLDRSYSESKNKMSPLYCVPVLIKDNISSYDGTMTSGSYALLGTQPVYDAFLVSQLRKAGALILGHTTMDEFAWGAVGISSRSGRVGNAYNPSFNPGGSSSGSGAAVTANFTLVAIGTDNSGSVRIPAAFNGIFGLRPSTGLISQRGIFPMGNLDGAPGPMARSVKDLALLLNVIASEDPNDPKTLHHPRVPDYAVFLKDSGLQNKRIGVVHLVGKVDTFKNMPNDIKIIMQNALKIMHDQGVVIVDNIKFPQFDNDRKNNMAGMFEDVNAYLASFPATRKDFLDICNSNRTRNFGNPKECVRFLKSLYPKSSNQYSNVLKLFQKNREYVEKIMKLNRLDALLIPITTSGVATYNMNLINTFQAAISSNTGMPSIAMNIGYANKMPIGVELVGKQFDEGALIEIAYSYEKHTPARILPELSSPNDEFLKYSIPEINHLYTLIGQEAYNQVLTNPTFKDMTDHGLTAEKFRRIVADKLKNKVSN